MASRLNLANIWRNVKELDLQQIRSEAERDVQLVIAGADQDAMQALANNLRSDPRRPDLITHTLIPLIHLQSDVDLAGADLVLLLVTSDPDLLDRQAALLSDLAETGQRAILVFNPDNPEQGLGQAVTAAGSFPHVFASPEDWVGLQGALAPAVLSALPRLNLALGRRFPLLRETVAQNLILDTSSANAAYSFSTGLAEIIPILDIPLNVADIIILTKAQALLVYKLGLALGMSTDWQYYVGELGGVIGGGFLWRQVARSLVGLIPGWGIVPKVAVAYSGTYAVGQAVLYWYLNGRHVTQKMLKGFTREAFSRGKEIARSLRKRIPRSRKKRQEMLEAGELIPEGHKPDRQDRICTHCGTINDDDARFCKRCGEALAAPEKEST